MAAMDPWIRDNTDKLEKFLQDFVKVRRHNVRCLIVRNVHVCRCLQYLTRTRWWCPSRVCVAEGCGRCVSC